MLRGARAGWHRGSRPLAHHCLRAVPVLPALCADQERWTSVGGWAAASGSNLRRSVPARCTVYTLPLVLLSLLLSLRKPNRGRLDQRQLLFVFKGRAIVIHVIVIVTSLVTLLGTGQGASSAANGTHPLSTTGGAPHGQGPLTTTAAAPTGGPFNVRIASVPALLVYSVLSLAMELWFLTVVYRAYRYERAREKEKRGVAQQSA